MREIGTRLGLPYIIEMWTATPLHNPVVLCGTMLEGLRVLRHRSFQCNFPPDAEARETSKGTYTLQRKRIMEKRMTWRDFVQVTGGGNCSIAAARNAMQIDCMTKGELNEAISAYTQFIGKQLFQL